MSNSMTVYDIIRGYLVANNFDGLFCESVCACQLSDLIPCGECFDGCEPGYKTACPGPHDDPDKSWCGGDCDFHISREKPEPAGNNPATPRQCPSCGGSGKGKPLADGYQFTCPTCGGKGEA